MAEITTTARVARVDMTPMVDLGFLLIISFMISSFRAKPNIIKLNIPSNNRIIDQAPIGCFFQNPLHLIIGKDNRIFWYDINEIELTKDCLKEVNYGLALRELIIKKRKESLDELRFSLTIYAIDEASYKNVVDVLDEMAITKQDRYILADITSKSKQVYEAKLNP